MNVNKHSIKKVKLKETIENLKTKMKSLKINTKYQKENDSHKQKKFK